MDQNDLIRNRYEPLEQVGRGGQATVLRALDHQHQREVAIKVYERSVEREDVLGEARVLLTLPPHPALPTVREDFFLDDGRYCIVMDWIPGANLSEIARESEDGTLPCLDVLRDLGT